MIPWLINDETFDSLNLSVPSVVFRNQAPDEFRVTQTTHYDADPAFAYGETVTIKRDGTQFFLGTCTAIQRSGTPSQERITYTISGPWWQLQQVIYQQSFARYSGGADTTVNMSNLILGADTDGSYLHSGDVITAVLGYAATQLSSAALFAAGTIGVSTQMPYEEIHTLSCAEAIQRVLRWNPDAVAYFDYAATTPVLHVTKRASLSSLTLTHNTAATLTPMASESELIVTSEIRPRNDLQRDGVVIHYEREDNIDGDVKKVVYTDSAGTTTNPLKTLYLYFSILGGTLTHVTQRVETETIHDDSATWWKARHPRLQGATNITIANNTHTAVDDEAEGYNDGTYYGRELVTGSIAEWMDKETCAQIVEADVTYTPASGAARTERLRLQLTGTDATTRTYSSISDLEEPEPWPTGLPAAILSSISTLAYEGSISLTEADIAATPFITKKINIAGGRTEWESMNAQVFEVSQDLESGTTNIRFGPPKHLGATDLFQLFRNVRTRKPSAGSTRINIGGNNAQLPNRSPNTIAADDSVTYTIHPFRVIDDRDGTVSVIAGQINNVTATALTPAGKPTELWLDITTTAPVSVSAVAVVTTEPTVSTTTAAIRIATITWDANVPTITQFVQGSQQLYSCGTSHLFSLT